MVSFCPRCGAEGGFGAAGCRRCGHQFAGWAVFADLGPPCTRCGHQGPADAGYCVRCGAAAPEPRFNEDDTVFFRRDPAQGFQAVQGADAAPRPAGRLCVVCGQRNLPGTEFCWQCETVLPMADDDTVPPPRRSAVPPIAPVMATALEPAPAPAVAPAPTPVSAPADEAAAAEPEPYFKPVLRRRTLVEFPVPEPPPLRAVVDMPIEPLRVAGDAAAPPNSLPPPPSPPPPPPPLPLSEAMPAPAAAPAASRPPALPPLPEADPDATVLWPASAVAAVRAAAGQRPEPDEDDAQETRQLTEDDYDTRILDDTPMTATARRDPLPGRRRLAWAALSVTALAIAGSAAVAYMSARPAAQAPATPGAGSVAAPAMPSPLPLPVPADGASLPASNAAKGPPKAARRAASAASLPGGRAGSRPGTPSAGAFVPPKQALPAVDAAPAAATPQPGAARAEVASAAPAAMSVAASCSIGNGFISEQLCRVRLCQQPEHARDPVCIEHRRMEAQNRRNDAP